MSQSELNEKKTDKQTTCLKRVIGCSFAADWFRK